MINKRILAAAGLAASILLAGCTKEDNIVDPTNQPPAGVTDERSAMQHYAANDEFGQNSETTMNDGEALNVEYGVEGGISGDLSPLRFGRIVRSIVRQVVVNVLPGDTIAHATVTKDIHGVFRVRGIDESGDTVVVNKEFHDRAEIVVIFRRVNRDPERFWRNWVPVARSLVKGGTVEPNDDIAIGKIETFLPNGDTIVVVNPLETFLRYRWLAMLGGGVVDPLHPDRLPIPELVDGQQLTMRVTLTSSSPDTDLVALRFGFDYFHKHRVRMALVSESENGDGTFTRVYERMWTVPPVRGFFHVAVDAMTRGTIYSDSEPYSVSWWGVPYRVF